MLFIYNFVELITLVALFVLFYVYFGYPILLKLLTAIKRPPQETIDSNYRPSITLIVSCFNEADVIKKKLENSLAIDYPKDKFKILVVSDGSEDATDDIAKSFADSGVYLIRQEGRLGKTSAINMAMETIETEIVVFSDANAMYEPDSVRKLTARFTDEEVGYVVGAALYTDGNANAAADSENKYWKYELSIKDMESQLSSVVGGDGAIYAIRRSLYIPLDAKDINDFVNPLQIIAQGYRGVFEKQAIAYEETAGDFAKEAKRKQRIVNRSFRGLMKMKTILNPFKYGLFSLQVISHKLLRWFIPVFISVFALGSLYLSYKEIIFYQVITVLGIAFLFLAQLGFIRSDKNNLHAIFYIPYYFIMVNYYSLKGIITAMAGNIQVTWSTPRAKNKEDKGLNVKTKFTLVIANLICLKVLIDTV